jgi:hypothetical protein
MTSRYRGENAVPLFTEDGMGIAPIIKLSVVNGTSVPLLFLPRVSGGGTNESQPLGAIAGISQKGEDFLDWAIDDDIGFYVNHFENSFYHVS